MFDKIANMGSVIFYLGIIMADVAYGCYSLISIAVVGFVCALYSQITKK